MQIAGSVRLINMVIILMLGFAVTSPQIAFAAGNNESGVLDGKVFFGKMSLNLDEKYDDKIFFDNGKFWSEICIRCGFQPGDYWTRVVDGVIHFKGEIKGGFGTFHYQGKVVGDKIESFVVWRKERWYWTSSRKLSFIGTERPGETTFSAIQASKIGREALLGKLPEFCW